MSGELLVPLVSGVTRMSLSAEDDDRGIGSIEVRVGGPRTITVTVKLDDDDAIVHFMVVPS